MTLNLGGWIHSFTVTDTQTHKGGYTIYKITSIVFPRSVPQALTCLVVWKRFHDVKRLHRELSRRHKSLKLPGKLPEPTDSSYFKRFDADVIQRRKKYILELLDFAAQHPALYKCCSFAQFLRDGTPTVSPIFEKIQNKLIIVGHRHLEEELQEQQTQHNGIDEGAITEICDKLDLPYDASDISLLDETRDEISNSNNENDDTNTNATKEQQKTDNLVRQFNATLPIPVSHTTSETTTKTDYTTRFLTPMASIESDDSDYIYEAALEFSHAVQAEVNLEYKEAHERYKRGVELLLHGSQDDANDERKFIAKAKISKYLARADEIYTNFLSSTAQNKKLHLQLSLDVVDTGNAATDALYLERPWNQLAKYKVVKVLGERVMQVQCITEPQKPHCIMKGVEKPSSNAPTQSIFLPQQVPYMIELLSYFQSEQKIFLLLKQAEGGLLYDYIQSYNPNTVKSTDYAQLFPAVIVDSEAAAAAAQNQSNATQTNDFSEQVRSSQQLLKSVSNTLHEVESLGECEAAKPAKGQKNPVNLPEQCLRQWACELAVAIQSLHGKGVILSDLHMNNLLLGAKGQLLLSYFYQNEGLSSEYYVHKALSSTALAGHFVAPERPLTFKSDWWSYGVVLYQLLIGLPFKMMHPGQIDLYGSVQFPDNIEITENARDLLDNLLQLMPESRFDYEQMKSHAFFSGVNWQQVLKDGLNVNGAK